ncbi:MAG: (Fe-S)-binding protein [Methanobacteriaceae archaeon]|nr:(Fe-S)-binding protein [Methanobacteriaceae archaeon]
MLYFRGCVAREKETNISKSTEAILREVGIDFKTISNEICCGSVLMRTGFLEEAKDQMQKNIDNLKGQKVLVSCAGCYKTFKEDYKEILGVELDVIHTSQLFKDLIVENKIIIKKSESIKVTYHDPCHLGRHCYEYESPREVLKFISSLVEMENNRENSRCCGSGGGVKSAFPEIAINIAQERLKDAEKTMASLIITSCPFCKLNLNQAYIANNNNNNNNNNKQNHKYYKSHDLEVLDLSEFLLKQITSQSGGLKNE